MQEHFYESGSCVQKNCASLGVHPTTFGPNSVLLTNSTAFDISSVWFNTPQSLGSFNASFTYTATFTPGGLNPADGVTFALQNTSTNFLGSGGGHLGYSGGTVGPSA